MKQVSLIMKYMDPVLANRILQKVKLFVYVHIWWNRIFKEISVHILDSIYIYWIIVI